MVCFDLGGDYNRAARLYDRLKVIKRAASLGGIESLVSLPVLTSQWGHTEEQLRAAGVTPQFGERRAAAVHAVDHLRRVGGRLLRRKWRRRLGSPCGEFFFVHSQRILAFVLPLIREICQGRSAR